MEGSSPSLSRASCSSLRDHDSHSVGVLQKTYNRKRRLANRGKIVQGASLPKSATPDVSSEPNSYVDVVAMKYAGKANMTRCRTTNEEASSVFAIQMRLSNSSIECSVNDFSCGVSMCGRVFDSIHVLAFHMSYAHHDVSRRSTGAQCLVCGVMLDSAKGKIAHMMSRHRLLANDHNLQCLEQRETVISPLAPAASRIEFDAINNQETRYEEDDRPLYENSTLQDICDMIVIPEVDGS